MGHSYDINGEKTEVFPSKFTGSLYGFTITSLSIVFSVTAAYYRMVRNEEKISGSEGGQKGDTEEGDGGKTNGSSDYNALYLQVFQIYLYGLSLFLLLYIYIFFFHYRRKERMFEYQKDDHVYYYGDRDGGEKNGEEEDEEEDGGGNENRNQGNEEEDGNKNRSNVDEENVNDYTENAIKIEEYDIFNTTSTSSDTDVNDIINFIDEDTPPEVPLPQKRSPKQERKYVFTKTDDNKNIKSESAETKQRTSIQKRKKQNLPITFRVGDVNFHLRIGVLIFGAGYTCHNGFQLAQYYVSGISSNSCYNICDVLITCLQITFTFLQAFFLYKFHKMVVRIQKAWFSLAFVHLLATNLVTCITAFVTEVFTSIIIVQRGNKNVGEPLENKWASFESNYTYLCPPQPHYLWSKVFPYLYPCTIQYSLLSAAVMYVIFKRLINYSNAMQALRKSANGTISTSLSQPCAGTSSCEKSHKGIFIGSIVVTGALIAILCYYVFDARHTQIYFFSGHDHNGYVNAATIIFFCLDHVLLIICVLTTLVAAIKLTKLGNIKTMFIKGFLPTDIRIEKILLLAAFPGVIVLQGFYILTTSMELAHSFKSLKSEDDQSNRTNNVTNKHTTKPTLEHNFHPFTSPDQLLAIFTVGTSLVVLFHALLQTRFLLEGLDKKTVTLKQRRSKPGRAIVTFLWFCNLALMICSVCEPRRFETNVTHSSIYNGLAWILIRSIAYPSYVFFRFNSIACLYTIWKSTYFNRETL